MNPRPKRWVRPLQLPHRPQYPPPNGIAVQVGPLEHGIRPHGGLDRRVRAGGKQRSNTLAVVLT